MSDQDRRDHLSTLSDGELMALLDERPLDPFVFNWIKQHRAHVLRRHLLLHEEMGGYLGRPARRWLGREP